MQFKYHPLLLAILFVPIAQHAVAQSTDNKQQSINNKDTESNQTSQSSLSDSSTSILPTIVISANAQISESSTTNLTNTVNRDQLIVGAATLGEALAGQPGIHTDSFGGGASRAVIRGQNSPRVAILADSAQVMDASSISPDHAVTIEPMLSERIEILRGPSTLLYSGGAIGGAINVLDNKIPSRMPENNVEGELNVRGNTVADEKVVAAGITLGLGDQFAVHVEGIKRDANNYKVRGYKISDHDLSQQNEKRVDGSYASGETTSIGLSWIGDQGFAGIAYTQKNDDYGLPGHSHDYDSCHPHATHLHCGSHSNSQGHQHDDDQTDSEHDHSGLPRIALDSKRLDFKAEYDQPFSGIEKVKFRAGYTDYQHQEIDEDIVGTQFNNKGYDARVELMHQSIADVEGTIGLQYSRSDFDVTGDEAFIPKTLTENISAFLLEKYQWNNVGFELGARHEWQTIQPKSLGTKFSSKKYDANSTSIALAAAWQFIPDYELGLSLSHTQRLPSAQELYANGGHFASNTYELGDADLNKEKSNNISLSLSKNIGDFNFDITAYHNKIDDYIYAKTLDKFEDFRLTHYTQGDAHFNGLEAQTSYNFDDVYKLSVLGDYVRAKLDNAATEKNLAKNTTTTSNLPRIPAARLGSRLQANWDGLGGSIGSSLEYYHVFKQSDIAQYESTTTGYDLVNAQLSFDDQLNDRQSYRLYLRMNNLLNKKYYSHSSFLSSIPQAGRNFTAAMQFKF